MEIAGIDIASLFNDVRESGGVVAALLFTSNALAWALYCYERADRRAAWKARNGDLENFLNVLYDLRNILGIIKDRGER